MDIRFSSFWQGFDVRDNFFIDILRSTGITPNVTEDDFRFVDLEIVSVFPAFSEFRRKIDSTKHVLGIAPSRVTKKKNNQWNARRTIWYTGENIDPTLTRNFDGTLSFNQNSLNDSNAYLPLWYLSLGIEKPRWQSRVGVFSLLSDLLIPRSVSRIPKNFACAFIGNLEPRRMEIISRLQKRVQIDLFGSAVGRPVQNKIEIAKNYKFSVCFENEISQGYVTEKLLEAYLSETIPLYWGHLDSNSALNKNSFLNYLDFPSEDSFIERMLCVSDSDFLQTYNEPFLNSVPNFEPILQILLGPSHYPVNL